MKYTVVPGMVGKVAIKQLFLKKLPEDLIKDFENETKVMAQVAKCANIVKLLGICLEEGHYAMIMEYVDKGSLYQILRDVKVDLPWQPLRRKLLLILVEGFLTSMTEKFCTAI